MIHQKVTIKREDIIPFALSQGGNYSRHNLYVESHAMDLDNLFQMGCVVLKTKHFGQTYG